MRRNLLDRLSAPHLPKTGEDGGRADKAGCVSIHHGEFVADGVTFDGCATEGDGGAIYAEDTRVTLRRCSFDNCASGSLGGAVCLQRGELRIEHSRFSGARAGLNGGAIHAKDAPVTVLASTFHGTEAARDGGALEVDGPSLIVRDSNFTECRAKGRKQVGGAIRAFASSEITGCVFESIVHARTRRSLHRGDFFPAPTNS